MKKSDIKLGIFFILLAIALGLSSCVNQRSVARWVEKNGGIVKVDSVFVTDTLTYISERVQLDTIFKSNVGDTVYLQKDKLKIKYIHLPGDSIYVEGICEADTITVIEERWVGNNLSITKPETVWDKIRNYSLLILGALLCLYALLVIIRTKRRNNEQRN